MTYCNRCEKYFNSEYALDQHLANSSRHNICNDCNKDFATWQGIVQHWVQSRLHPYCQRCNEHFSDGDELEVHYQQAHYYCPPCGKFFESQNGLEQHDRLKHFYCIPCKRYFSNENSLNVHLRTSALHNPRTYECPGRDCHRSFISYADLVLHLESGTCPSGADRRRVNEVAAQYDRNRIITNPRRLITGPDGSSSAPHVVQQYATQRSWNGSAFECPLCYKSFAALKSLNAHLGSAAHADRIYRCPSQIDGCGMEFRTLSGLMQHIESGRCGVHRFRNQIHRELDNITSRMGMLAWY